MALISTLIYTSELILYQMLGQVKNWVGEKSHILFINSVKVWEAASAPNPFFLGVTPQGREAKGAASTPFLLLVEAAWTAKDYEDCCFRNRVPFHLQHMAAEIRLQCFLALMLS